jgi:GNAT superfamily N-acetyltransferase
MELIRFKGPDELKALWVNISASTCAEVAKHDVESPDIHVYVAEAGSDVVGFVKYTFEEKTWGKTCDIASLVVTEPWRSKGIGRELMAHAEQKARDAEAKVASLHVLVGNEEGESFYEGLD